MNSDSIKLFIKNPHFKYGASFCTFLVVGALGLKEFAQIRYDIKKRAGHNLELQAAMEEKGIEKNESESVEEVYENLVEKVDLNEWFNIRGPRPGEDSKTMQEEQRRLHNEGIKSDNALVS